MTTANVCKYLVLGLIVVLISITLFVKPETNKPCVNCNKPSPVDPLTVDQSSTPAKSDDSSNKPDSKPQPKSTKPKPNNEKAKKVEFNTNHEIVGYDSSSSGLASWQ